jgi:Holliday junction resolvase RusA-like endonuclease
MSTQPLLTPDRVVCFTVYDTPKPGGSKKAIFRKGMKHPAVVEDCSKNKDWRASVKAAALEALGGRPDPLLGPVMISVTFYMPRPLGHYRSGDRAKGLKANAPDRPTTKPDTTKLFRSTEDALTGILWADDAEITTQVIRKRYADPHPIGADIAVWVDREE